MNDCDMPPYPELLRRFAKAQRIPLFAQLELTARCNFNFRMCYIHMDDKHIKKLGQELTTDEWLRICREAKEAGTLYISLTGGEIFTRPDFQELYTKLSEMGFLITLMTNASMIDEKVMSWLKKRPPYMVRISLYGSNNDVYRSVCQVENGFCRVDKAIRLLQEAGIPIVLKSIVIKNNASDIREMYRYASERKLNLSVTEGIAKPVRGASSEASSVRFEPYLEESKNPDQVRLKKLVDGHGPFPHRPEYLMECKPYGSTFTVSWDGKMSWCSFLSNPYVDLNNCSVDEAWQKLMEITSKIHKPEACNNCKYEEYCLRCPGVLAAECGSYDQVSEDFCQRAKRLYFLYNGIKRED